MLKLSPEMSRDISLLLDRLIEVIKLVRTESEVRIAKDRARSVRERAKRERAFTRRAQSIREDYLKALMALQGDKAAAFAAVKRNSGLLRVEVKTYLRATGAEDADPGSKPEVDSSLKRLAA